MNQMRRRIQTVCLGRTRGSGGIKRRRCGSRMPARSRCAVSITIESVFASPRTMDMQPDIVNRVGAEFASLGAATATSGSSAGTYNCCRINPGRNRFDSDCRDSSSTNGNTCDRGSGSGGRRGCTGCHRRSIATHSSSQCRELSRRRKTHCGARSAPCRGTLWGSIHPDDRDA